MATDTLNLLQLRILPLLQSTNSVYSELSLWPKNHCCWFQRTVNLNGKTFSIFIGFTNWTRFGSDLKILRVSKKGRVSMLLSLPVWQRFSTSSLTTKRNENLSMSIVHYVKMKWTNALSSAEAKNRVGIIKAYNCHQKTKTSSQLSMVSALYFTYELVSFGTSQSIERTLVNFHVSSFNIFCFTVKLLLK